MEQNLLFLNNKIISNSNNILLEIINELHQIMNYSKDNLIIKILSNVINKANYIISENNKNFELIRNDISSLYSTMNKRFDKLDNNSINNQKIQFKEGKYIGQIVNGLPEGKGIYFYDNGDKYEGEFKKGIRNGRGIFYYKREPYTGDRYEGDWKNGTMEGKGIYYSNKGDRYEGEFRNGVPDGQGIDYFSNGDRRMGDYSNGKPIGKHVRLTKKGEIKEQNF